MKTDEQVLTEIRQLRSRFDELSLQMRVDTPWVRAKTHMRYAINFVREIPFATRFLLLLSTVTLGIAFSFTLPAEVRKRLLSLSLNFAMLAVTVINYG